MKDKGAERCSVRRSTECGGQKEVGGQREAQNWNYLKLGLWSGLWDAVIRTAVSLSKVM
jgi:hypothetical protein